MFKVCPLSTLLVFCWLTPARAIPPELARAVPDAAPVAILVDAARPEVLADSSGLPLAQWATTALSVTARSDLSTPAVLAEAISTVELLRRYPWAIVVTDVSAQSLGEGSFRLGELHAAIVVLTRGDNVAITHRIQDLLARWTSRDTASIANRTEGSARIYTLTDARLPGWARIRWGSIGDYYVVSLGDDSLAAVRDTLQDPSRSLANQVPLYRTADGNRARVAWRVRLEDLRRSLAEVMAGKPDRVLAELGLDGIADACWTVRRDGRALVATVATRRGERITVTPISESIDLHPGARAALPDEATGYACIPHPVGKVLERIAHAWLASRRPKVQENVTHAWQTFEQNKGVSIRADLLNQLGDTILIHDYPLHPLRLPIARTMLFEISGSPDRVRNSLDALLVQCAEWLTTDGGDDSAFTSLFETRLERLPDGVWTLRAGLYGPAVAVHERWLIVSYAPAAVRENLRILDAANEDAANEDAAKKDPAPAEVRGP